MYRKISIGENVFEKIAHSRFSNNLKHTSLSLSFPEVKVDPRIKNCTPHRCAILSSSVHRTGIFPKDILQNKKHGKLSRFALGLVHFKIKSDIALTLLG